MKLKSGFILRKCGEADIVVPVGANVEKYKNIICFYGDEGLNQIAVVKETNMVTVSGSGKILWELLEKGCERNDLVNALLSRYDVERDIVERDVDIFVKKLTQAGILDA